MPIATQTDVEQRRQINFTSDTDPVAATLIAAAQGHVEGELGRPLEQAAHTELFDGLHDGWPRKILFLKYLPIISITTVIENGITLAGSDFAAYLWTVGNPSLDGRLVRLSAGNQIEWRSTKPQGISVTYQGGWPSGQAPKDLVDVVANMAADAFVIGAAYAASDGPSTGLKAEEIGDYRVEYAGPDWTTVMQKQTLEMLERAVERYRIPSIA